MLVQRELNYFSMVQEKWFNTKTKNSWTKEQVAQTVPTVPATSTQKNQKDKVHLWSNSSSSKEIFNSFVPQLHISCKRGGVSKRIIIIAIATV